MTPLLEAVLSKVSQSELRDASQTGLAQFDDPALDPSASGSYARTCSRG